MPLMLAYPHSPDRGERHISHHTHSRSRSRSHSGCLHSASLLPLMKEYYITNRLYIGSLYVSLEYQTWNQIYSRRHPQEKSERRSYISYTIHTHTHAHTCRRLNIKIKRRPIRAYIYIYIYIYVDICYRLLIYV